ncbi:unnamed protein product [Boreogadus saida]
MCLSAVWFVVSAVSAGKQQRSDLSIMPAVTYRVELGFPPLEDDSLNGSNFQPIPPIFNPNDRQHTMAVKAKEGNW